jgi:hypothetical protein
MQVAFGQGDCPYARWYAVASTYDPEEGIAFLHRLVMATKLGEMIDHRDQVCQGVSSVTQVQPIDPSARDRRPARGDRQ